MLFIGKKIGFNVEHNIKDDVCLTIFGKKLYNVKLCLFIINYMKHGSY